MTVEAPQAYEAPWQFRERLAERERDLFGFLDYPNAKIIMVCDSRIELDFRLGACRKEPETVEWIERVVMVDDVFYDIGACSGSYALIAAARKAQVFAFEPSASNYRQLTRNAVLNRLPITSLPFALGSERKLSGINLSSPAPGAASHTLTDEPLDNGHAVIIYPLDDCVRDFALPPPCVIKCDVDGGEAAVLGGAKQTLLSASLRSVMVEVSTASSEKVARLMAEAGLHEIRRTRRIEPTQWNVEYGRP